jgi:RNA polymerase sigma-70 factor, ECF subfamily
VSVRRICRRPSDDRAVNEQPAAASGHDAGRDGAAGATDGAAGFLAFYDEALPQVYGYLSARCGRSAVAEDLTAETFLAAVDAARRPEAATMTLPWVIGVARHKLVDHWRREARDERRLRLLTGSPTPVEDPWDAQLDAATARAILLGLAPQYRAALTLRYLDDLPVADVAALLGRSLHATEALLVRARVAFRRDYESGEASDG